MSRKSEPHIVVVQLPLGLGLHGSAGKPYLKRLDDLLTETELDVARGASKAVLVVQEGAAFDWSGAWQDDLESSALLKDLALDLLRWRRLLAKIRHGTVPWGFASAYDCQGAAWEMALSCHWRAWFEPTARLGFPDIEIGAFPPGGLLESLGRKLQKTREMWQDRPVCSAVEARAAGLIHTCRSNPVWFESVQTVFRRALMRHPTKLLPSPSGPRRSVPISRHGTQQVAQDQLAVVWQHNAGGRSVDPTAWDYCWQLFKERARLTQPDDLDRLVCYIAARHYLSPTYGAWLARRRAVNDSTRMFHPGFVDLPVVTIDLDGSAPPTSCLVRLLKSGVRLMLVSSESRPLANSLNLIFGRLERLLGTELQDLWLRQVAWATEPRRTPDALLMRWTIDDRLEICRGTKRWILLRLAGNAADAPPGVGEWPAAASSLTIPDVAACLFDLVVDGTLPTESATSIADGLRLAFFSACMAVAVEAFLEPSQVIEALQRRGWAFGGSEESWDRFLKSCSEIPPNLRRIFGLELDPRSAVWDVGSLKQARAASKRQRTDRSQDSRKWNDVALSTHMASYAYVLTTWLATSGSMRDMVAADCLVAEALGFPDTYGTPLHWAKRRGEGRINAYCAKNWPQSKTSGLAADALPDQSY